MEYYDMLRNCKDKRYYRLDIVKYAKKYGIKPAARKFDTTPKTVRKWIRRFDGKLDSLADLSHAPKNPKTYIMAEQRMEAIKLNKKYPAWGTKRLKREFNLTISEKAILKIWRKEGLIKLKRRKHKTKKYLRELKKKWKFCQQMEHDVKYLTDIPEYWPQMKKKGSLCINILSGK
jgi:transposase